MSKNKKINEEIRANRVKIIDDKWEQLWTFSLEEALKKAEELELDLVEVWEQDWVALVKLMDYGKFLFKQQKNINKSKTNSKKNDLKTVRLTYKIWDHDLEIRKNQCIKFAKELHPVKVELRLKWRENHYANQAQEKINLFIESLSEYYKIDWKISKAWTSIYAILHLKK